MGLFEQAELVKDEVFRARVQVAVVKAAVAVMAEDDATENHANRVAFAGYALINPEPVKWKMIWGVVTNGAVTEAASDGDIEFTVNSMWDGYADAFVGVGL